MMRAFIIGVGLVVTVAVSAVAMANTRLALLPQNIVEQIDRRPGWLGITLLEPDSGGVLIGAVLPKTAAAQAGLQADDRVLRIGDVVIDSSAALLTETSQRSAGDTIALVVEREGVEHRLEFQLQERPADMQRLFTGWYGSQLPWPSTVERPWPLERCSVLVLWASWCPSCRASEHQLAAWRELGLPGDPKLILAAEGSALETAQVLGRGSPLSVSDFMFLPEDTYTQRWFVSSLPHWFLISADGEVITAISGTRELETLRAELTRALSSGSCGGSSD